MINSLLYSILLYSLFLFYFVFILFNNCIKERSKKVKKNVFLNFFFQKYFLHLKNTNFLTFLNFSLFSKLNENEIYLRKKVLEK